MDISTEDMFSNSLEAESFLKQFANANRLMLLCVLLDGELSVSELNNRVPVSQSALSQHLSKLREAGLVTTRRESQVIYYKISDRRVQKIIKLLYQLFCKP